MIGCTHPFPSRAFRDTRGIDYQRCLECGKSFPSKIQFGGSTFKPAPHQHDNPVMQFLCECKDTLLPVAVAFGVLILGIVAHGLLVYRGE